MFPSIKFHVESDEFLDLLPVGSEAGVMEHHYREVGGVVPRVEHGLVTENIFVNHFRFVNGPVYSAVAKMFSIPPFFKRADNALNRIVKQKNHPKVFWEGGRCAFVGLKEPSRGFRQVGKMPSFNGLNEWTVRHRFARFASRQCPHEIGGTAAGDACDDNSIRRFLASRKTRFSLYHPWTSSMLVPSG